MLNNVIQGNLNVYTIVPSLNLTFFLVSEKKAEGCKSNHLLNKIRQAYTVLTSDVQIIVFLQLGSCEVDALNVSSTL